MFRCSWQTSAEWFLAKCCRKTKKHLYSPNVKCGQTVRLIRFAVPAVRRPPRQASVIVRICHIRVEPLAATGRRGHWTACRGTLELILVLVEVNCCQHARTHEHSPRGLVGWELTNNETGFRWGNFAQAKKNSGHPLSQLPLRPMLLRLGPSAKVFIVTGAFYFYPFRVRLDTNPTLAHF